MKQTELMRNRTVALGYLHNMHNDPRIKLLRLEHGAAGHSVWCLILEAIYAAPGGEINITPVGRRLLAADLAVDLELLEAVVMFLARNKIIQFNADGSTCGISDFPAGMSHKRHHILSLCRSAGRLGGIRSGQVRRRRKLIASDC